LGLGAGIGGGSSDATMQPAGMGLGGPLVRLQGAGSGFGASAMLSGLDSGGMGGGLGAGDGLDGTTDEDIDDSRMEDEVAAVLGASTPGLGASSSGQPVTPLGIRRTTSRAAGRGSPDKGRLWGRVAQPVEGCEIAPILSVQTEDGRVIRCDEGDVTVRWFRSEGTAACAYANCPETGPRNAELQSVGLGPSAGPRGQFCSPDCFAKGWQGYVSAPRDRRTASADPAGLGALLAGGADPAGASPALADLVRTAATAAPAAPGASAASSSGRGATRTPPGGGGGDPSGWHALSSSERAFAASELARTAPVPPSSDTEGWSLVHEGTTFTPRAVDVLHSFRVDISATVAGGTPLSKTIASAPTKAFPEPPARRRWLTRHVDGPGRPPRASAPVVSDRGSRDSPTALRVVSFNVLAEIYCNASVYPYCPSWALSFEYRRRLLERELRELDGDVVCLQEVQTDHYSSFYLPLMASLGYEGLFRQKARRSMGMEGKVDGCALFFRAGRFKLLEKFALDFNEAVDACYEGEVSKTSTMPSHEAKARQAELEKIKRRLKHDNVAQVAILEMVASPTGDRLPEPVQLCVTNTHLYWDPAFADVKLWQTHALLGELEKTAGTRDCPIVLCGDFNSDQDSAVHALISGNRIAGRRVVLPQTKLPPDDLGILSHNGSSQLSHGLVLASAYGEVMGREPEFTNFTKGYTGCLDYIWCTARHFVPVAVLAVPPAAELSGAWDTALPNPQHPSDHVALCTDLVLRVGGPRGAPKRGAAFAASPMLASSATAHRAAMAAMAGRATEMPAMGQLRGQSGRPTSSHPPAGLGLPGSGHAPDPSMWIGSSGSAGAGGAGAGGGRAGMFPSGMAALGASPQRMHQRDGSGGHGGHMGRPDYAGGPM